MTDTYIATILELAAEYEAQAHPVTPEEAAMLDDPDYRASLDREEHYVDG